MKSFGCLGMALAGCVLLGLSGAASAGWPWEKEKPREVTAWGWKAPCDCVNGERCTCRPGECNCARGIGCHGKSGGSAAMDASDTYMVGGFDPQVQQRCFINASGQKQCYQNGVLVPCDQPAVQYVAAPSAWSFPLKANESNRCPCCDMEMSPEQMAKMKAKMAAAAPVATYAAAPAYAAAPMYMATSGDCASGNCASGNCGTASAGGNGGGFRAPIRRLLFRGRGGRGGCGG